MLHCDQEDGSVGGVFDPVVSSAIAVFEHVKDKLAIIPLFAPSDLVTCTPWSRPF